MMALSCSTDVRTVTREGRRFLLEIGSLQTPFAPKQVPAAAVDRRPLPNYDVLSH